MLPGLAGLTPEEGAHPGLKFFLERCVMAIDKELLEILACPKCKGKVKLNKKKDGLVCEKCRLVYPVKDDIPVMLIDEALPSG